MRIINFRLPFTVAIFVVLGIVTVALIEMQQWVAMSFVVLFALVMCFVAIKVDIGCAILCLVAYIAGGALTYADKLWTNYDVVDNSVATTVSGYVTDTTVFGDNYIHFVLRDVNAYQQDNQTKLLGAVSATIFGSADSLSVSVGDRVTLSGCLGVVNNITLSGINTWEYRNNIRYTLADATIIDIAEGKPTLPEQFRITLLDKLQQVMPNNYDIAYALITGDKSVMTDVDLDSFRTAGIVHILAVSGLHVSFLSGAIMWLLNKMRAPFWLMAVIVTIAILFYAYLCGFPASILRAVIMTIVMLIVYRLRSSVDMLNSMSIAMVVILFIKPLYLFDAGFVLSFSAVFGICCFQPMLRRTLFRLRNCHKFVRAIITSVWVTLSATVGTLPAIAYYYGQLPLLGVFVNLLVVPIISVIFVWTLLVFLPFVNLTLIVPDFLLGIVRALSTWIASLSFATIALVSLGIGALAYAIAMFVLGGFVNVRGKLKVVVLSVMAVIVVVCMITSAIPTTHSNQVIVVDNYGEQYIMVIDDNNIVYALGDISSQSLANNIVDRLQSVVVKQFVLFTYSLQDTDYNALETLSSNLPFDKIYAFDHSGNIPVENNYTVIRVQNQHTVDNGFEVGTVIDGTVKGLYCNTPWGKVVTLGNVKHSYVNLYSQLKDAVIISASNQATTELYKLLPDIIYVCPLAGNSSNIYGINKYGNFTIVLNNGTIAK